MKIIYLILLLVCIGCTSIPTKQCVLTPVIPKPNVKDDADMEDITYRFTTGEDLEGWHIYKVSGNSAWDFLKKCINNEEPRCDIVIIYEHKIIVVLDLLT